MQGGRINCARVLRNGDRNEIARFLLPVFGIGPKVLSNFYLLRQQ